MRPKEAQVTCGGSFKRGEPSQGLGLDNFGEEARQHQHSPPRPLYSSRMAEPLSIDQWSSFDHKNDGGGAPAYVVDERDIRRLGFYRKVRAYIETVAREFLTQGPDEDDDDFADRVDSWREFGDPAVLVARVAAAVIGDGVLVGIKGADDAIPDQPDISPAPIEPGSGLSAHEAQIAKEVFDVAVAVWTDNASASIERWANQISAVAPLQKMQDYLQDWASSEQFIGKVYENETEYIVPSGSGVYTLGWDAARSRVRLNIHSPEVYFPVLDEAQPGDFPTKVHLAWPFSRANASGEATDYVRRITYELLEVGVEGDGEGLGAAPRYLIAAEGGDAPVWAHSCVITDGVWPIDAMGDIYEDDPEGGEYAQINGEGEEGLELRQYPIGLDFIPVVHMPNTLASVQHFGRSTLARLAQIFDEIAATDADESLASRWAARPPVALSGMQPGETSIDLTPGRGVRLGPNGRLTTVDMAPSLEKIGERLNRLLKRLSVNAQVPEGLLGRVDAGQVASGVTLTISFTSFEQLIDSMRIARDDRYSLLLKFVQRIAIQNEDPKLEGVALVQDAELRFGSFMPQDLAGLATTMSSLRSSGLLSQETGVAMAQESGVPSKDIGQEVSAIRSVDGATADLITGALENPKYAARYMGVSDFDAGAADGVDPDGDVTGGPGVGSQDDQSSGIIGS